MRMDSEARGYLKLPAALEQELWQKLKHGELGQEEGRGGWNTRYPGSSITVSICRLQGGIGIRSYAHLMTLTHHLAPQRRS